MKFGYILDAVNKAIPVSNLFGAKAGNHSTVDGVPLGTAGNATTGEVLLKVSVRESVATTETSVAETVSASRVTVSTASPVVSARSIIFICSKAAPVVGNGVDFAGTILGLSRQPGETIEIRAQSRNTLASVAYTVTAGSLDIIKTV